MTIKKKVGKFTRMKLSDEVKEDEEVKEPQEILCLYIL